MTGCVEAQEGGTKLYLWHTTTCAPIALLFETDVQISITFAPREPANDDMMCRRDAQELGTANDGSTRYTLTSHQAASQTSRGVSYTTGTSNSTSFSSSVFYIPHIHFPHFPSSIFSSFLSSIKPNFSIPHTSASTSTPSLALPIFRHTSLSVRSQICRKPQRASPPQPPHSGLQRCITYGSAGPGEESKKV